MEKRSKRFSPYCGQPYGERNRDLANVVANATPRNPMFFMRVYVDQLAVYFTFNNSISTQIFKAPGAHTLTVMAEDEKGYTSATPLPVIVSAQGPNSDGQTTIAGIRAMAGWQSCGELFPAGSGRAGQICAAGGELLSLR